MADATTIERLQVEIGSNSSEAVSQLMKLRETLNNLKSVCRDGCGLNSVANGLSGIKSALNGIDNGAAAKLSSLVNALSRLAQIGKFNLPSTLSQRLTELGSAVSGLSGDIGQKITAFSDGMQNLSRVSSIRVSSALANNLLNLGIALEQLGTVNLSGLGAVSAAIATLDGSRVSSSLANQLDKLRETADRLRGVDFSGFTNLSNSLAPLIQQLNSMNGTLPNVAGNLQRVASASNNLSRANTQASASNVNLMAGLMMAYKSVEKLSRGIAGLIDKSNTFIESYNLFSVSLGQFTGEAEEYANRVGELMGIDPGAWMRNQGVFQTLAEGFGVASDRAYIMSKNLTQLGYDLSSFFNIAVDGEGGAMQKLQAGLSGELEPLRRLGFDLSQARLQAVALSLGIDQTFNSMTQAQKAQLRYYAILTQVTTAQGDMARTLDTPANQLRILKAQVEQAGRAIGNIFIPMLNRILPYAIAAAKAVRLLANAIASFFGFTLPEVDYGGIGEVSTGIETAADSMDDLEKSTGSARKQAKELKELLADWDELNIIQSESGGGEGTGSGGALLGDVLGAGDDWSFDLPQYDFLGGLIDSTAEGILAKWRPAIDWLQEHLTEVGMIAAGIGASFLEWSLAKRFIPSLKNANLWMSKLFNGIVALGVEAATIALNVMFTANWLQTGNLGALVGGTLTDIVGSSIFGKIVQSMFTGEALGETAGTIATGVSFLINGIVSMGMAWGDVHNNGLTAQNLITMAKGAVESAIGFGLIGKMTFAKDLSMVQLGSAALFMSLGVGLNLMLTEDVLNGDGKDPLVWIAKKVGGLLAVGGASFITASKLGLNAVGKWTLTGATLMVSSGVNFVLNAIEASKNGWDESNIISAIVDTIGFGVGAAAIALGPGGSLPVAATLGAAALLIGIAATAAIAISSASASYAKIEWGDVSATADELKKYVEANFFSPEVTASINVAKTHLTNVETARQSLNTAIGVFNTSLKSLMITGKIAAGTEEINSLKEQLIGEGGLVQKVQNTLKESGEMVRISATVVPLLDSEGNDKSSEWLSTMANADSLIGGAAQALGDKIAELLTIGYDKGLDARQTEWLNSLWNTMAELSASVANAKAGAGFTLGVQGLLDFDRSTFSTALDQYKQLRDNLETELAGIWDAMYMESKGREEGLRVAAQGYLETGDLEKYNEALAEYEKLVAHNQELFAGRDASIKASVDQYTAQGQKMFSEAFASLFSGITPDLSSADAEMWISAFVGKIDQYIRGDATKDDLKETFSSLLVTSLTSALDPADAEVLKQGLEAGLINITDLIDSDTLNQMFGGLNLPAVLMETLDSLDGTENENLLQDLWNELLPAEPLEVPAPDTTAANDAITGLETHTIEGVNAIRGALSSLDGVSVSIHANTSFPSFSNYGHFRFAAAGGTFDAGELFVAREAGPEMVGRIGRRTAVANNDQIEGGIASGVREANSEQTAVLNEISRYARAIAGRGNRFTLEPSTALARTVKRSEEMRLESEGV